MRISFQALIAAIASINVIQTCVTNALNVTFNQLTSDAAFGNVMANSAFLTKSALTFGSNHYPINSFLVFAGTNEPSSAVFISVSGIYWHRLTGLNVNGTIINSSLPQLEQPSICQHPSGDLFVLGGSYQSPSNQSYVSNDHGITWSVLYDDNPVVSWSDRLRASCSVTSQDDVLAIAGLAGGSSFGDINSFDMSEDSSLSSGTVDWRSITAHAFQPRYGHATVTVRGQGDDCADVVYVIGGLSSPSNGTLLNDVLFSTDGGHSWFNSTAAAAFSPRMNHAVAVASNGVLAISGGEDRFGLLNDLWLSLSGGADWLIVTSSAGFAPRSGHSMIFDEFNVLYVMGDNDVWILTQKAIDVSNLNSTSIMLSGHEFNETCASLSSMPCNTECSEAYVDQEFLTLIACAVLGSAITLILLLMIGIHARRPLSDPELTFQQFDSPRNDYGAVVDEDDQTSHR